MNDEKSLVKTVRTMGFDFSGGGLLWLLYALWRIRSALFVSTLFTPCLVLRMFIKGISDVLMDCTSIA